MKRLIAISALSIILLAGASFAWATTSNVYLNGNGSSSNLGFTANFGVSRATNGTVRGIANSEGGFQADAIEIVEPAGVIDYWCVNAVVTSAGPLQGQNFIWFIKDLPTGDQMSYTFGPGLNCATAVVNQTFQPVDSGDFVGEIVPDTCASDLATCNAQNASLQTQLNQCNSDLGTCNTNLLQCNADLGTCNSDLTTCENQANECSLPVLTDYSATLKGSANVADLNGKVRIKAKRDAFGVMKGSIKFPDGSVADVNQVNAPSCNKLYWCVKGAIIGQPGSDVAVFVRNTGTGCDRFSYTIGTNLDCDTAVPTQPFVSTLPGDFKEGKIRCGDNQCCAS